MATQGGERKANQRRQNFRSAEPNLPKVLRFWKDMRRLIWPLEAIDRFTIICAAESLAGEKRFAD